MCGLTKGAKKTKILKANIDWEGCSERLVIRGEQLERVKEFVFLLKEIGASVTESERRINRLLKSIWNQSAASLRRLTCKYTGQRYVINGTLRSYVMDMYRQGLQDNKRLAKKEKSKREKQVFYYHQHILCHIQNPESYWCFFSHASLKNLTILIKFETKTIV